MTNKTSNYHNFEYYSIKYNFQRVYIKDIYDEYKNKRFRKLYS